MQLKTTRATLALLVLLFAGCASTSVYSTVVAEEKMVVTCSYIDTIAENSDMGAFQIHPKLAYGGRERVLQRAEMLSATHVVWMTDYSFGSAAIAYRCSD
jgi:hypothetical protein